MRGLLVRFKSLDCAVGKKRSWMRVMILVQAAVMRASVSMSKLVEACTACASLCLVVLKVLVTKSSPAFHAFHLRLHPAFILR